jgi:hypothetical protein
MKKLIKKLLSYTFSCVTGQHFSRDHSNNNSSVWGTNGIDPQIGVVASQQSRSNQLWSNTCNQPNSFFPSNPLTDLGVMRLSGETITSVGHSTTSSEPNLLINPEIAFEDGKLNSLLHNYPNNYNVLVDNHLKSFFFGGGGGVAV